MVLRSRSQRPEIEVTRINSRQKGAAGEREAGHVLTEILGKKIARGCQFRGSPDSPDVSGLKNLHVEVKRVEKLNLDEAMEQATRDKRDAQVPVVMHRKNRGRWFLTIRVEDLWNFTGAVLTEEGCDEGEQTP